MLNSRVICNHLALYWALQESWKQGLRDGNAANTDFIRGDFTRLPGEDDVTLA